MDNNIKRYFSGLVYNEKGTVNLSGTHGVGINMGGGLTPPPSIPINDKGGVWFLNICNPAGDGYFPYGWGYGGDVADPVLEDAWVNYGEEACDEDGGNGSDFAALYKIKATYVWTEGGGQADSSYDTFNQWHDIDDIRRFYLIPIGSDSTAEITIRIEEIENSLNYGEAIVSLTFYYLN